MSSEMVRNNLSKVISITKKWDDELDKDGSRFNIFSILNVSSNEVRLHSNFIAELLNHKGTHSFRNEFCKLFISQLLPFEKNNLVANFNFENYNVEVEKSTGLINQNYTSGGRIDILITDNQKRRIIIENKIFASDQQNQLLRYYNFDKQGILLYLTLNGNEPNEWSTNNEIQNNKDFHCISYKSFISNWLENCIVLSKDKPKVSETISQYLHVIKNYTNQNIQNKMTNEIVNLIANNKEFYNSIDEITNSYNIFRQSVNEKFWREIRNKKPNQTILTTEKGIDVKFDIEEDGDGFYFGFYLEQNGVSIKGTSESVTDLANTFKEISATFITNDNYIGWTYSNAFRKFWWIDKERIFELNDETEMNEFTDQIVNEIDEYINEIKKRVK
jgi:hypothetical protein